MEIFGLDPDMESIVMMERPSRILKVQPVSDQGAGHLDPNTHIDSTENEHPLT